MIDKVNAVLDNKPKWNLEDMAHVVDMYKDLSEIEKNCVKTNAILSQHSEELY